MEAKQSQKVADGLAGLKDVIEGGLARVEADQADPLRLLGPEPLAGILSSRTTDVSMIYPTPFDPSDLTTDTRS